MKFTSSLLEGTLVKRYKRFLADIILQNGQEITAHCANSGSMMGVNQPGSRVWVSPAPENSKRKLAYTWELVESDAHLVGIHTHHANALVEEALQKGVIQELAMYQNWRREVPYGEASRVDFVLSQEGLPDCFLEIKSVHLKRGNLAQFPDAVTARGAKHMMELAKLPKQGLRSVILYVVQRSDCDAFSPADDIDPVYAQKMQEAVTAGVEKLCYQCHVDTTQIFIEKPLPFKV